MKQSDRIEELESSVNILTSEVVVLKKIVKSLLTKEFEADGQDLLEAVRSAQAVYYNLLDQTTL